MANNTKPIRFKKNNSNKISMVIFAVILIYIIICLYISSKNEPIVAYEVKNGSLFENRLYTGIALRDEHVMYSDYSGYVNYFVREGERAAYNNLIYCINESGKVADTFGKNPLDDNSLSKGELKSIRQDLMLFAEGFDEKNFIEAYSFEQKNLNLLSQINNRRIIEDVNEYASGHSADQINYCRAKMAGITAFFLDGYENKSAQDLTEEDFNQENYVKTVRLNDDIIERDSFVYKCTNSENWSICILVPLEEVNRITSYDYVEVSFLKNHTKSWGKVNHIKSFEKYSLIELEFTNSMVSFAKDRFVDIELLLEEDSGLKIPNSAIAEKAFYIIDKKYLIYAENSTKPTVLRREYSESGELVRVVEISIYKEEEDVVYVDKTFINYGDVLLLDGAAANDNSSTFVVGKQGTLTGVYNINKGYADFNRIEILYSNDEYSIVSPASAYGLRAYDHIALDASIVSEKDFVY